MKRSVWQNPDQERNTNKARIFFKTTLTNNKIAYYTLVYRFDWFRTEPKTNRYVSTEDKNFSGRRKMFETISGGERQIQYTNG